MSHGADTALLGTTNWNTPARQLYAMSGFRAIYQVRWYIWEADARVDRWRLPQAVPTHQSVSTYVPSG